MKFKFLGFIMLLAQAAFCQVDVDTYSGRPSATIHLHTLQSGSLSFPVALSYSGGGIKADSYGGPVGTGWNISSGSIVRDLKGLPDDYYIAASGSNPACEGWLINNTYSTIGNFTPVADDNLSDCTDEQSDFNFLTSLGGFSGGTLKDTEPDVYYINVPGLNGSFTFDNTGKLIFIIKQDYKVTYTVNASNAIVSFQLIDEKGITYSFGLPLTSYVISKSTDETKINHFKYQYFLYKRGPSYNSAWRLLSIESPNGDRITFEYDKQIRPIITVGGDQLLLKNASSSYPVYANVYNQPALGVNNVLQYTIEKSNYLNTQFSRAIGRSEKIEITNSSIVVPYGEYSLKQPFLSGIKVYDLSKNTLTRNFKVGYEIISDGEDENGTAKKFIFLRTLSDVGALLKKPPYVFDYYGVDFSAKMMLLNRGRYKDCYGFLNKNASTWGEEGSLYKIFIYPGLIGADRIRNKPIINYVGDHHESQGENSDAYDLGGLLTANLKQITSPTGGVSRIFYEPQMYRDVSAQSNYYGGGIRVKRLEYHDGVSYNNDIVTDYKYEEDDGTSTGLLLYRPVRAFTLNAYVDLGTGASTYYNQLVSQGLSQEQLIKKLTVVANGNALNENSESGIYIGYKKVTVSQTGKGKIVYEYDIAAPFGTESEVGWTATKNKIARQIPASASNVITYDVGPILGTYTYPFAPNPNYEYKRGLPKRVTHYDNNGVIVKQVENEYTFLSNPVKIYALKLDQYKALLTYTIASNPVTGGVPMFIYSRYEINANIRPRLLKSTTKVYDQNSSTLFTTGVQIYEYNSIAHDFVTRVVQTGSDGVEYANHTKYPSDYTVTSPWVQQDNSTKAITQLLAKNIIVPIEKWSTKKEGAETPLVVGAELSLFEYDQTLDNIYLKKSLTASAKDPFSSFTPSSVNNVNGASSSFVYESSKYNISTDYLNMDGYGNAQSTLSYTKQKSSYHEDLSTGIKKATILNALAEEVVFSDFESISNFDFSYSSNNVKVPGRTAGYGINLLAGSTYKLSRSLTKGNGSSYTFSCWIKSAGGGSLTIRVNDGAHTQVSAVITFSNTNASWKYYSSNIVTSTFNTPITVEVESNVAVNIDDVIFYPASSQINTYLFGNGFTKIAETNTTGVSSFFEYDEFERLVYVRDHDQNIIKAFEYASGIETSAVNTTVDPSSATVNVQTTLTCHVNQTLAGATYKWKIMTLSNYQANPTQITDFATALSSGSSRQLPYTFSQTGTYIINVQIMYQGATITCNNLQRVEVSLPPLAVSICTNRPTEMDLCYAIPLITTCNATQTSGMILKAVITGGSGSYTYEWRNKSGVIISTASLITITDYIQPDFYSCEIKDQVSGRSGSTSIQIKTFASDPNCMPPNGG